MRIFMDRVAIAAAGGATTPAVAPIGKSRGLKDRHRRGSDQRNREPEPCDTVTLSGQSGTARHASEDD